MLNKLIKVFQKHFKSYTTPVGHDSREGLTFWREKILLFLMYVLMIFVLMAYIPSIILSITEELWAIAIVDTAAYGFLIYIFLSKRLSVRFRSFSIMILGYLLGSFLLLAVGPYGAGYLWLFIVPVLASILSDLKATLFTILLNALTLIAIGTLQEYHIITPLGDSEFSTSSWIVIISNFVFLEIIITLSIAIIIQGLEKTLNNEKDITKSLEFKTTELKKAKEKAEYADKMKSDFLAQMSHEIRTPINTILNSISLIRNNIDYLKEEERKEIFGMIQTGSSRVIRTIDLILNMSEIQNGGFKIIPERFSLLTEILDPLVSEFTYPALKKNLILKMEAGENCGYQITADKYAVTQIFVNLLDNAVKYTKQGTVKVKINDDSENIYVNVIDTGIGISDEYLRNIFTPFSQEESGYTRHYDGNGLGLALVKKYCELNDAKISVESHKGRGSKFTVVFNKNSFISSN